MSKLEELIREYCPDGVEYKPLKDCVSIMRGTRVVRNQLTTTGEYPVFQNSLTPMGYYDKFNCEAKNVFIIVAGAAGEIGYSSTDFWAADDCFCLRCPVNIESRFLYHYLLCQKSFILSKVRRASIPRLAREVIENLAIPVPPLPVQEETVSILDNLEGTTEQLVTELTAELTARKQQYEYYRNKLLMFNVHGGGTSRAAQRTLGDIAKFVYGYTDKAKDTGDVRFIRITDINDDGCLNPSDAKYVDLTEESKKYLLRKGDLLLARTGATYGKTLFFDSDEPAVYASFLIKIVLDKTVIRNRYYWHFSKSSLYREQAEKYVSKGGQQQFNANAVSKVKVPVPSLEVQDRIIGVLDNFDAICTDLNIGLPAEIEARRKQYEFYRDQLLTFAARGETILTDRQTDRQTAEYNALIRLCQYVFGYSFVKLSLITNVFRGEYITKKDSAPGNIPVILGGQEPAYYIDRANHTGEAIVIARSGASAGFVSYWNEPVFVTDGFGFEAKQNLIISKFLYYSLKNMEKGLNNMKRGAGVPHISGEELLCIPLYVPQVDVQERIVAMLDHFDTLCTDLTSGLPAEIDARQKQYEYYRDRLLSFEEKT